MAIGWFVIILPLLLFAGLGVVILLWTLMGRGKPVLSEPYCAKCGYDLRVNWDSSMICPECGADLKAKSAVHFGKTRGRSCLLPILMLLSVPLLLVVLFALTSGPRVVMRAPVALPAAATMPTQNLIANLPSNFNDQQVWQELGNRYKQGMLSNSELGQLQTQLIAGLKLYSFNQRHLIVDARLLVERLILDQVIAGENLSELMEVFYGPGPMVFERVTNDVPEGFSAVHGRFAHAWTLGVNNTFRPHCRLVSVTANDEAKTPLLFLPENMTHWLAKDIKPLASMPISVAFGSRISLKNSLPQGQYVLNFTFITELFPSVPDDQEPASNDVPIASVTHVVSLRVIVDETGRMQFQSQDKSKDR